MTPLVASRAIVSASSLPAEASGTFASRFAATTRRLLLQDRRVYAIVLLHAGLVVLALSLTGQSDGLAYATYLAVWPITFFLLFPTVYVLIGLLQVVHRIDRRRSLAFRRLFSAQRTAHFLAGMALLTALMIFQGSFTSIKNAFPAWWGGFPHDLFQAELDRLIHFGTDPWRYLLAVGGNDIVRSLVEWNYNQGWFVFCYVALFWIVVAPEAAAIRTRYMLTYLVVWLVVGNVLAGLFLSAGPAFYHHVTGDAARFAEQIAFLERSADSRHAAWRIQAYLWGLHDTARPGFGSGISAFPSMHVALVTLNALFLWERSRRWGLAAFAYVALIAASSVYLAWHYAIDSYVSIAVTAALFLTVRRAMRRNDPARSL